MYADPEDPRAKESRRKHYRANREIYMQRAKAQKQRFRELLAEVKSRPCEDCGNEFPPYAMDLDHRPGAVKLCNPSRLPTLGNERLFWAEIEKCDVVCAVCHRIRTHLRRSG